MGTFRRTKSGRRAAFKACRRTTRRRRSPCGRIRADYLSRNAQNDPDFGYYGSNTTFITLNDRTRQKVEYAPLHPWINQPVASTRLWNMDASIGKTFPIGERMGFQVKARRGRCSFSARFSW
jgi:hypothetical protein